MTGRRWRAAVANGADAVYFGLSNFNARAPRANFPPEELPTVMDFLHARNVRGFVTLNTLIFSDELEAVAEFVKCRGFRRVSTRSSCKTSGSCGSSSESLRRCRFTRPRR